jgi:hypothetical protein
MEAMKQMKLDNLKARIGNADYEVDVDAVAEAVVRRVLAARYELQRAAANAFNGGTESSLEAAP